MNFITKKHLSRRTVLKGLGTSLTLPMLGSMTPAMSAESKEPLRFGVVYLPNGIYPDAWHAKTVGKNFEFNRTMISMEPHREYVTTISNLMAPPGGKENGGIHMGASAAFLNGYGPEGKKGDAANFTTIKSRKTIDQYIADKISGDTPLRSIEVGTEDMATSAGACDGFPCVFFNTMAWKDDTTPLPISINPLITFERLFGEPGTPQMRYNRVLVKQSMLDSVLDELTRVKKKIGAEDNSLLENFTTSVREVEIQISKMAAKKAAFEAQINSPVGVPELVEEHLDITYELIRLAFQTDLTRVFSFLVAHEASGQSYNFLGLPEPYHSTTHHGNVPEKVERYIKLSSYQVAKFSQFVQKMKDTPTSNGNLLDASYIYFGAGMSNGNAHDRRNVPAMLVGKANGKIRGNMSIAADPNFTVPTSNLLLTLGDIAGAEVASIGRSTGRFSLQG